MPMDCNTGFSIYWLEGKKIQRKSHKGYYIIFKSEEHKIKEQIKQDQLLWQMYFKSDIDGGNYKM